MADITDDFSGTLGNWDETRGSGWTITGGMLDTADAAESSYAILTHNTALGGPDHWAKITLVDITAGDYYGLFLRGSAQAPTISGYLFLVTVGTTNATQAAVYTSGSYTADLFVSSAITWADGDVLGCSVEGTGTSTVVSVWQNPVGADPSAWGAADATYTLDAGDTQHDTGNYVGQSQWSANGQVSVFDNFEAGQIGAASSSKVINNVIRTQLLSGGL